MADHGRGQRLFTFLLVPAIVVSVLVLDGISFRNSFQLERLREQSLIEATLLLANEKADRLEKRLIEQDNAVASLIDVGAREHFGDPWLDVAALQTPTVRAVYLLDLSSPHREIVAVASRFPGPEDDAFRHELLGPLLNDMRLGEPQQELRHLHGVYDAETYLISYWQREFRGRRYLLVAWHDIGSIIHQVFPDLYGGEDEQSKVNVVDNEGRIIYGPPLGKGQLTLGRQFETTLYKWRLNVTMTATEELAAAVARRRTTEMALVGLSGLVVIAGLAVVLMAVARERKLSALKSEFVANVSHELKTPLALVRMFSELLSSGRVESEEKRQQYLRIILSESERLGALIENVLDFARADRGKAAYDFNECDLRDVVGRAVEACRVRAASEQVDIELGPMPEATPVTLDERAVEIAIINLIDNALKYAAEGKVVRVDLARSARTAEIRITDRGPGVPAAERRRIFERFVRSQDAATRRIRGSGIGLALVRQIAEAHGGKAWVVPAQPQGSTFIISLRRDLDPSEPVSPESRPTGET